MGSRIGFCVRDANKRSGILRQQWASSIKEGTEKMWTTLGGNPGDGGQAIRHDLDISRGFAALVYSIYQPPFNSIQDSTLCDIANNGLIEIDISDYKDWKIYHIKIGWKGEEEGKEEKKTLIATMNKDGFKWVVSDKARENMGEGLF